MPTETKAIEPTRTVPGFSLTKKQQFPFSMIKADSLQHPLPVRWDCGRIMRGVEPALSEAQRNRLVEAAKSPTQQNTAELQARRAKQSARNKQIHETHQLARMLGVENVISKKREIYPDNFGEEVNFLGTAIDLGDLMNSGEFTPVKRQAEGGDAAFTVVSHRTWDDSWRIRTQVDQCSALPPEQEGDRLTTSLSLKGAQKIADSCQYMHLKRDGYRTFQTLTFDDAGRCRVELRKSDGPCTEITWEKGKPVAFVQWLKPGEDMTFGTIQKEVSRYLDSINKMRARGWKAQKNYPWGRVTCYEREGKPVGEEASRFCGLKGTYRKGARKNRAGEKMKYSRAKSSRLKKLTLQRLPVRYCWVVENPLNERGQRNPHVHILMDWRVKFSAFASWADRIESIWGQGFATLEKIKDSEVAGAYMAKAAGYLSKAAGESDQGPVKGNRYGISARSRAPDWECQGRFQLGHHGAFDR